MGTSTSNRGPGPRTPIVPPWADDDDGGPGPEPDDRRYLPFRTRLGNWAKSGDPEKLGSALGHYTRTALGGRATGARRYARAAGVGGAALSALSGSGGGGPGGAPGGGQAELAELVPTIDLSELEGLGAEEASAKLAEAFAPEAVTGDDETIRAALQEAMAECMGEDQAFDPESIDLEWRQRFACEFVVHIVALRVELEACDALTKSDDPRVQVRRENEMRDFIRALVDVRVGSLIADEAVISQSRGKEIISELIAEVLGQFEGYD